MEELAAEVESICVESVELFAGNDGSSCDVASECWTVAFGDSVVLTAELFRDA